MIGAIWKTWCLLLPLLASGPAAAPKEEPKCRADSDCVLSELSCGFCGRCSGTPPYAISKKDLKQLEERCKKEKAEPVQPVACSPCPPDDHYPRPFPDRAVCKEGECLAGYTDPCAQAESCCHAFQRDIGNKCDWNFQKGDGTPKTCNQSLEGYRMLYQKVGHRVADECR